MIRLNKLSKIVRQGKRKGRGTATGKGKTAGRGTKGQKSRAGFNIPVGFEGGQTPLKRRLPKFRGFVSRQAAKELVPLDKITKVYKEGEAVNRKTLKKKGLILNKTDRFKIIASEKFKAKLTFEFVPMSKKAEELIKKAGSKIAVSKTKIRAKGKK